MNPLTNVKNITKLNETELSTGLIHKKSWHDMYKDSAWIFIGGLEYGLTEGDVLTVFSQYGEIVNINLVRDKKTGKSKGFCFLCYANQKSTVLAVDNFNGIKLCNRTIRVDHVLNYKPPKESDKDDEITKMLKCQGCAPEVLQKNDDDTVKTKKKSKKEKKEKKKKKKQKNISDANDSEKEMADMTGVRVKKEKHDPGYDKYDTSSSRIQDPNKRHYQKDNLRDSRGGSSHTGETYQSERHHGNRDNFVDKNKLQVKRELESDNDIDMQPSTSKRHKKQRSSSSSSSDHHVSTNRDNNRHRKDISGPERQSNHKKNYKNNISSSSSDDGSSTDSSDDEKHSNQNKYCTKDRNKSYEEKRGSFEEENRDRNYDRSKNSDFVSSKSQHSSKKEKYTKHKLKANYRNDDSDDSHHKSSHHHKRKYSKK